VQLDDVGVLLGAARPHQRAAPDREGVLVAVEAFLRRRRDPTATIVPPLIAMGPVGIDRVVARAVAV
jgi:hypothetical protein